MTPGIRLWALVCACGSLVGCAGTDSPADAEREIGALLDAWHLAAATGDGDAYFGAMTDGFVFLGTDASERWARHEFIAFAEPYFDSEEAWTYTPTQRWIEAGTLDRGVVWFDELLQNEKYGTSRGSGVVVREGAGWKIGAYSLSFPIPNELAVDMTAQIKAFEGGEAADGAE